MADHLTLNTTRKCTCCGITGRVYKGPAGQLRVAVCQACDLTPAPTMGAWKRALPPSSG